MEFRDIIHGAIQINTDELKVINSSYFQRLRQIRQVGFAEHSFPSATHTRFIHSLGTMETATQIFDSIFSDQKQHGIRLSKTTRARFRQTVRLAALLHDIGHGPLSHTIEAAMPPLKTLDLPPFIEDLNQRATHENYTLKFILNSGLTSILKSIGKSLHIQPVHIAGLMDSRIPIDDQFFIEKFNFRPILSQIISSEIDADRMDYLRRDSLQTGVSYGQFDGNWLINHLTYCCVHENCYLSLEDRALYAFEDFLISRFHMFLMVYFHHKSVIYEAMLNAYLLSAESTYWLPPGIEDYCQTHDAQIYAHLAASQNPWAKRIIQKKPYEILIELHSGIPGTAISRVKQKQILIQLKNELKKNKIHYLQVKSTSKFSKYFLKHAYPIFVQHNDHYHSPSFISLDQCTDLFKKYKLNRTITRLYVAPQQLKNSHRLLPKNPIVYTA